MQHAVAPEANVCRPRSRETKPKHVAQHRNCRKQSTSAAADKPREKHTKITKVKKSETTTDTLLRRATLRRQLRPKRQGRDRYGRAGTPKPTKLGSPGVAETMPPQEDCQQTKGKTQQHSTSHTAGASAVPAGQPVYGPELRGRYGRGAAHLKARAAHEAATPGPQRASNSGMSSQNPVCHTVVRCSRSPPPGKRSRQWRHCCSARTVGRHMGRKTRGTKPKETKPQRQTQPNCTDRLRIGRHQLGKQTRGRGVYLDRNPGALRGEDEWLKLMFEQLEAGSFQQQAQAQHNEEVPQPTS